MTKDTIAVVMDAARMAGLIATVFVLFYITQSMLNTLSQAPVQGDPATAAWLWKMCMAPISVLTLLPVIFYLLRIILGADVQIKDMVHTTAYATNAIFVTIAAFLIIPAWIAAIFLVVLNVHWVYDLAGEIILNSRRVIDAWHRFVHKDIKKEADKI